MQRVLNFLRIFYSFSIKHMLRHRWRALSVICGIALGASVFTSVRMAVYASLSSFTQNMDLIAGKADHTIMNPGSRVTEQLIPKLLALPAISSISPMLSTYVSAQKKVDTPFLLIGIDPILDRSFREWSVSSAGKHIETAWLDLIRVPGTVMLSKPLADHLKVDAGDSFSVVHPLYKGRFHIIGILSKEGLGIAEGGFIAITDIATFQESTRIYGEVDRIDLILNKNAPHAATNQIRDEIQPAAVLADPSDSKKSGQQLIRAYQLNLSVLGFASLFVGMFLVYSLISLNASARRQELAVLRSLGASRSSLFGLFLAEGLMLGMLGWFIAIPISSILLSFILHGISNTITTLFVRVQVTHLLISLREIGISFSVTVIISGLAGILPARQAMQVQPRETLTQITITGKAKKRSFILLCFGLLCFIPILPLSFLPGINGIPLPGYLATLLLFTGFALVVPFILQKLSAIISPFFSAHFKEPGKMAIRYIQFSGTRTAISVGALITAVALFTALVIMIHSFRKTVEIWVKQTVSGDLFVSPLMADLNQDRDILDASTVQIIHNASNEFTVIPLRRFHFIQSGVRYQLEATDLQKFIRYGNFLWVAGDPPKAYKLAATGQGVLISEVMSSRTRLNLGDFFEATISGKHFRLPVVGIIRDYRTHGGVVFCSLHFLEQLIGLEKNKPLDQWNGVRLFLKPNQRNIDQNNEILQTLHNKLLLGSEGALHVTLGPELRQKILKIFDETFAITFVLLVIALLVATLGIATTMTILILERSSQLNTLVAVGADQRQIRKMVFWEAGFMVIVGELLGLICGFLLSYLLVYVINAQSFGWTFLYQVDWKYIWISLPLIFGTTFLAALPAIRLAFHLPPADLLRERPYG